MGEGGEWEQGKRSGGGGSGGVSCDPFWVRKAGGGWWLGCLGCVIVGMWWVGLD